jgi:hypothetical protein
MESVEVAPPSGGGGRYGHDRTHGVGKTTTLAKLAAYFSLKAARRSR